MKTALSPLKQRVIAEIDARQDTLVELSKTIHANPELGFKEFKASKLLCDALEQNGYTVQRGLAGLETAFRAEARGAGDGPTIALLAEYDALAEMGHACGHNIIATATLGAAIALRSVLDGLPGRVLVIGTPAEEGGGGKVILIQRGAFKDVDAAMMVHPSARTMTARGSLASYRLDMKFTGKASHAASSPEDGINALEGVILTFNNINGIRLHMKGDARVHGIITNGGAAVNIVPESASAAFSVRAANQSYAQELTKRVIACAEGAALATGTQVTVTTTPGYAAMAPNLVMAKLLADNWRALGIEVHEPRAVERMGSTDFGDVSQALPGIHAYIGIVPDGTPGHSVEIRAAAISDVGHAGLLNAAKGMAMTVIDLLSSPKLMQDVKAEFAARA